MGETLPHGMHCLNCGYSVGGLPVGRCPECGEETQEQVEWLARDRMLETCSRSVERSRLLIWECAVGLAIGVGIAIQSLLASAWVLGLVGASMAVHAALGVAPRLGSSAADWALRGWIWRRVGAWYGLSVPGSGIAAFLCGLLWSFAELDPGSLVGPLVVTGLGWWVVSIWSLPAWWCGLESQVGMRRGQGIGIVLLMVEGVVQGVIAVLVIGISMSSMAIP